jgi:hypothetical protein
MIGNYLSIGLVLADGTAVIYLTAVVISKLLVIIKAARFEYYSLTLFVFSSILIQIYMTLTAFMGINNLFIFKFYLPIYFALLLVIVLIWQEKNRAQILIRQCLLFAINYIFVLILATPIDFIVTAIFDSYWLFLASFKSFVHLQALPIYEVDPDEQIARQYILRGFMILCSGFALSYGFLYWMPLFYLSIKVISTIVSYYYIGRGIKWIR